MDLKNQSHTKPNQTSNHCEFANPKVLRTNWLDILNQEESIFNLQIVCYEYDPFGV